MIPVLSILLQALDENRPVVVVSVYDGGQQVHPFKLSQPKPVLAIRHNLTQGWDMVEMSMAK